MSINASQAAQKRKRPSQVPTALDVAERGLQADLGHGVEALRVAHANGDLHALLLALGQAYLNAEQQEQVKRIVQLHKQCSYPLAYR